MFRFSKYLKDSGVLQCARDVHEYRRLKDLATALYRLFGKQSGQDFSITEDSLLLILQIVLFCQKLFMLDIRLVEHIPYSTSVNGLASVFHKAMIEAQPIRFLSFASNAVIPSTVKLREKKQYDLPNKIVSFLKQITESTQFRWQYEVVLADHDFLLPKEQYAQAWEANLVALQAKCESQVQFLSSLINNEEWENTIQAIQTEHGDKLEQEVERFAKNKLFIASFKATPERNRFQMLLYAALGVWLEQHMPTCVVLDIQKQMYPYEQPYFNRFRRSTLPLFRYAKKGTKTQEPEDD